jgi:hypothetical protein
MSDSKTGASEGYYQKLYGLSLAPGQSPIFFDKAMPRVIIRKINTAFTGLRKTKSVFQSS